MVVFSSEDSRKLASFIDPMVKYEDFWQNYDHFCNTIMRVVQQKRLYMALTGQLQKSGVV